MRRRGHVRDINHPLPSIGKVGSTCVGPTTAEAFGQPQASSRGPAKARNRGFFDLEWLGLGETQTVCWRELDSNVQYRGKIGSSFEAFGSRWVKATSRRCRAGRIRYLRVSEIRG